MHRYSSVLVLGLVLALTACAPSPEPTVPTASPTPSATSAPEILPGPRLTLGCTDLVAPAEVVDLLGEEVPSESWSPLDTLSGAALAQAGAMSCLWIAADDSRSVGLIVAPGEVAGSTFRPSAGPDGVSPDCYGEADWAHCAVALLAGDFAVEVFVTTTFGESVLKPKVAAIATRIVEQLSGSVPTPPWTAPETSDVAFGDCTSLDPSGAVVAAFTDVQMSPPSHYGSGDGAQTFYAALAATGYNDCSWSPVYIEGQPVVDAYVGITMLPGGSWNWETLRRGEPIDVAGVAEAAWKCDDHGCTVTALVGESVVEVNAQSQTRDTLADATAALAAFAPVLPVESR